MKPENVAENWQKFDSLNKRVFLVSFPVFVCSHASFYFNRTLTRYLACFCASIRFL